MAVNLFGSIYIGSYEVTLKIFEISSKKGLKEIDCVRSRLDLGEEAYDTGVIGYELVDDLCEILGEFKSIMLGYKVDSFEVYASAVFRNISNALFIINQVNIRTGIKIKVISNSEVRFMSYKSFAGSEYFNSIIKASAAVVDIGGSSIQITLFEEGAMTVTQRIEIGTMRLHSLLYKAGDTEKVYRQRLEEYLDKRLEGFKALYLKNNVNYIIFTNAYGSEFIKRMDSEDIVDNKIKSEKFIKALNKFQKKSLVEIARDLNLVNDKDPLITPSIILFKTLTTVLGAEEVWIPGVNINDGIAYDYAERKKLIKQVHDYEADIISASKTLSKHYYSHIPHIEALSVLSTTLFDSLKKVHGLGRRPRLLLQVATILHDCGKYVSLSDGPQNAYQIIMSSEIIGLTHLEREMVALIVLYNTMPLDSFEDLSDRLDMESYLVVAKLSAILRVANALDQSHRQKFENIKISLKDRFLIISVDTYKDITLEQSLFESKTAYFENVYSIKPILKAKKLYLK